MDSLDWETSENTLVLIWLAVYWLVGVSHKCHVGITLLSLQLMVSFIIYGSIQPGF